MKILIIDDSDYKLNDIAAVVTHVFPAAQCFTARSFQTGLKAIEDVRADIIIMDMTLPTSERLDQRLDGRLRFFGGRELMAEMELVEITANVIVVTQFDSFVSSNKTVTVKQLLESLSKRFPKIYRGGVHYSIISGAWRAELEDLLTNLNIA